MVVNIWLVKIKISVSGMLLWQKGSDTKWILQFYSIILYRRRERGYCQICWSTTAEGDFELTGGNTGSAGQFKMLNQ